MISKTESTSSKYQITRFWKSTQHYMNLTLDNGAQIGASSWELCDPSQPFAVSAILYYSPNLHPLVCKALMQFNNIISYKVEIPQNDCE